MKVLAIALAATLFNVGTIACIKKAKFAVMNDQSIVGWILGIAVTILITQYLLLWADIKGASLGLVVSFVIISVMVSAVLLDVDGSGQLVATPLRQLPLLEVAGYGLAILGVALVGISKQIHQKNDPAPPPAAEVADAGKTET